MDVKIVPTILQLLGAAAPLFAFATAAQTLGQDSFETSHFAKFWNQAQTVTCLKAGGAKGTQGFARLNLPGSALGGTLAIPNEPDNGLSDFSLEFYLRIPATTNGQFRLQVGDSKTPSTSSVQALSLCYGLRTGWGIISDGAALQPIAGLKTLSPDAWYRFRFTGRDWGTTNAHYDVQLSEPNGQALTTPAVHLALSQGTNSPIQPARYFTLLNTVGDHSYFDVDEVRVAAITPYQGPVAAGVNTKTLTSKVMCGYQGWFGAPDDGRSQPDWRHWTREYGTALTDGNAKVDMWPDVSELDAADRFPTGFKMADGRPAEVFSSFSRPTVLKHFQWMQEYGIDGVFVQRFANGLTDEGSLKHCNTVLASCREGANLRGRTYAVMYDLSGLPGGRIDDVINDWRALRNEMVITEDAAYLNHKGKPVVAVWGIGFNDGRDYSLAECRRLVEFLKHDPEAGGCTVMLGVPTHWRELRDDAVSDPALLEILAQADIISPWTIGRYTNPDEAAQYAERTFKPDQAWCHARGIDCLPVVFPGFSWHNMKGGPLDQIPRLRGQFLWSQFSAARRADASMVYVAMFDEVDEATAIFKCANDVPVGQKSRFVTYEGLPNDFYLKMVGRGAKLIRGEISLGSNSSTPNAAPQTSLGLRASD